jgi:hypothetical protein
MHTRAKFAVVLVSVAGLGTATIASSTPSNRWPSELTAHEWGTFTTVAGENGLAIDWLPLGGPSDLPCFVEHFQNQSTIKLVPAGYAGPFDYDHARGALLGKVRMETPVLYFYAPQETSVDVKVRFPRGLMTEWYPHAEVMEAIVGPNTLKQATSTSTIEWRDVRVNQAAKADFPSGAVESHYYAARATEAAPLAVGTQHERFLFYRGIADFDVPLSARALPNNRVRIASVGSASVPNVVLFERRGAALGFRVLGALHGDTTVDTPKLDGSLGSLRDELRRALTSAGLYPMEAAAMLETWRDSWFEEGVRVFYIVPPALVDAILPLEIRPAPAHVARVFVGRMEVITGATESAVERAIASNDAATLDRYGRFLGPISDRLMVRVSNAAQQERVRSATTAAFTAYLRRSAVCE